VSSSRLEYHLIRRPARRLSGTFMDLGLLRYRRLRVWGPASPLDFPDYSGPSHSYRYGILAGYLRLLHNSPSILDFGCGTGILLERIQGIPFYEYMGIDPSPGAVELARKRVPEVGTFVVAEDLPRTENAYDVVVCNEVLYYLPDPDALLDRIVTVLRPGGNLLTSNVRHPGDRSLYRMIEARFELVDLVEVRAGTGRWPHRRYRHRVAWHRLPAVDS
jgi:2-polyprenyl-3-methyl-5-hydroxy-6-metoxy-1,4-benzoquinol methylase